MVKVKILESRRIEYIHEYEIFITIQTFYSSGLFFSHKGQDHKVKNFATKIILVDCLAS
jgi:hypothetical protein